MKLSPQDILNPVFHFLDWIIEEWGVYLFVAFVWLSLILIAWIFSGGLRRKYPNEHCVNTGIGIIIRAHTPPPPPIIIHEYHPDDGLD